MNNKIFISGRVTGDDHYVQKFEAAEVTVKRYYFFDQHGGKVAASTGRFGYEVVNPTTLTFLDLPLYHLPWSAALVVCIWNLIRCSSVYMLGDWQQSRGATIEHKVAKLFNKHIIYQVKPEKQF